MTCSLRERAPEREVRGWEQGTYCVGARLGQEKGREGEMTITNAGFLSLWGHTRVPPRKGGMARKME